MDAPTKRNYESVASQLSPHGTQDQRMQSAADALWNELANKGVSWVGFYVKTHHPERGHEMILAARRDKPACSPIGMHGACGRCCTAARPLVVTDVANLGAGYIACDPRDRSEVVLPLIDEQGQCWGVLDLDSFDTCSFDETDVLGLNRVLEASGLTSNRRVRGVLDVV